MNRNATAIIIFFAFWALGALVGTFLGFFVGISAAWGFLYLTDGLPKSNRRWQWNNIFSFNWVTPFFWGIVSFHIWIQWALWSAPLSVHALLFSLTGLHALTLMLFVYQRPPKGPKQKKFFRSKPSSSWYRVD